MAGNLDNYVTVAERVTQASAQIKSISTDAPIMLTDTMGYIRALVVLNDDRNATGTASFRLDLQGRSAQATNPIEDCETSAIGRALAFLGFPTSKGIASREEVQEARRREGATYAAPQAPQQRPQPQRAAPPADEGTPICSQHGTPMRAGKNGGWFCPTKLPDGSWCKARSAKPEPVPTDANGDDLF